MTPLDGVPPSKARITEGGGKVVVSRVTKSESEGRCIFHHLLLNGKKTHVPLSYQEACSMRMPEVQQEFHKYL